MTALFRNLLFLLLSLALFVHARGKMQQLMNSKEVVAFEFLRTESATNALFQTPAWQPATDVSQTDKSDRLRINTCWDFIFILGYTLSLFFLARVLLGDSSRHEKNIGLVLLVAGLADALENLCILQILNGGRSYFPATMTTLAALKFGLLVVYLGWLVVALAGKAKQKMAAQ